MRSMKEPQGRTCNHYGQRCVPQSRGDTWLEAEEFSYPNGGYHRRARVRLQENPNNPVELPYGELRVVRCSIPDTMFTIPARLRCRGKTIQGYISSSEEGFTFTPESA